MFTCLLGEVPDVLELRRQRDDLLVLDLVEDDRAIEQAVEPCRTADLAPRLGEIHVRHDAREVDLRLACSGKEGLVVDRTFHSLDDLRELEVRSPRSLTAEGIV